MVKAKYKYLYGPVSSWRIGRSLGLDPLYTGKKKICSFDCEYCQAGKTNFLTKRRKVFIPTNRILEELKRLPDLKIDYITFSGAGEPTLAKNLKNIIKGIKNLKPEKIAILTNASTLSDKKVRDSLLLTDFVIAKLDAHSEVLFRKINRPLRGVKLKAILKGIREFKSNFKGKFALQIMFTKKNKKYAEDIASLACKIKPDEIEINTPLRPSRVKALSKLEINKIKKVFLEYHTKPTKIISVYDTQKKKKIKPLERKSILKRRGEL